MADTKQVEVPPGDGIRDAEGVYHAPGTMMTVPADYDESHLDTIRRREEREASTRAGATRPGTMNSSIAAVATNPTSTTPLDDVRRRVEGTSLAGLSLEELANLSAEDVNDLYEQAVEAKLIDEDTVEGTGANGNVIKADKIKALGGVISAATQPGIDTSADEARASGGTQASTPPGE
jgi:hypothetical protein